MLYPKTRAVCLFCYKKSLNMQNLFSINNCIIVEPEESNAYRAASEGSTIMQLLIENKFCIFRDFL